MSGTEQLPGEAGERGPLEGETPADSRLWDARREITELRARLAEQLERERILELEIAALRKDTLVKAAYAEVLEQAAEERQAHVEWLQDHFDAERDRADRATAELAAERARLYYRLAQPVIRALRRPGPSR